MGINGQDQASWQPEDLPFAIVTFLLEQFAVTARHDQSTGGTTEQQATLGRRIKGVIDANLLGYKYVGSRSPFPPDGAVCQIARTFSESHIDMHILCDHPTERHPSKRASCQRRSNLEKKKIRLVTARAHLQTLLSGGSGGDVADQQSDIHGLQKSIRSLESAVNREQLPADFSSRLESFVEGYKSEGKGEITFEVAPMQADPCVAQMMLSGVADFILSGDSDFAMYVGPGGRNGDLMLKDIKLTTRKEPIRSCKVYTGQEKIANQIELILSPKLGKSPFARVPTKPVFSGVCDPMVRALSGIVLGCDVLPGGVSGSGPAALSMLLERFSSLSGTGLHEAIVKEICNMKGALVKEKEAMVCLAESILYEKTNQGYMYQRPQQLARYLEAFADSDTEIVAGPETAVCKGRCGSEHPFLSAEGIQQCAICQTTMCRFCNVDTDLDEFMNGNGILCFNCTRASISGLTEGSDEAEMRAFLAKKSQNIPVAATYVQVLSLYEKANAGEFDMFDKDIEQVQYPLLPTSALHPSRPDFCPLKALPAKDMEKLFLDDDINMPDMVDILSILASLTRMKRQEKGEKLSYTHVVPMNVINIASNARVHTGERLCKQGVRHAMDAGTPDILNAMVTVAKHEDKVCLIIRHKILASMKSVHYSAAAAITPVHLLAAECSCKAGCQNDAASLVGNHRVTCTHSVALMIQMSLLMFSGMAHQILGFVRRRLRRETVAELDGVRRNQLREDLLSLIKASGECLPVGPQNLSIPDLLASFTESTGRAKLSPGEPNPRDLGLLRDKAVFARPVAKAEKLINHESMSDTGDDGNSATILPKGTASQDEYKSASIACDGISYLFGTEDEFKRLNAKKPSDKTPIGFRLLKHRSSVGDGEENQQEYSEEHTPRLEAATKLQTLLERCSCRGWVKSVPSTSTAAALRPVSLNVSTPTRKRSSVPLQSMETPTKSPGPRGTLYCCACGASNASSVLKRVPNFPPDIPNSATRQKGITHRRKCFIRREWTDRLGLGRSSNARDLRLCEKHPMETVSGKRVSLVLDGEKVHIPVGKFEAPVNVAEKKAASPALSVSPGVGTDREILRHVLQISKQEAELSPATRLAMAREGMELPFDNKENRASQKEGKNESEEWRKPCITVDSLTAKEVKRRTGFRDLKHLLSYNAVVYAGDMDAMAKTVSKLTWLEELVLYHEFSWGHSRIRLEDYANDYDCCKRIV